MLIILFDFVVAFRVSDEKRSSSLNEKKERNYTLTLTCRANK